MKLTAALFMSFLMLGMHLYISCRDPSEFEPGDPYTDPPDPPEFIQPLPDTTLNGTSVTVNFLWINVAGAELYEVQYDTATTFSNEWFESSPGTSVSITLWRFKFCTTYYYRIRAISASWRSGHTVWSSTRRLFLKPAG
jgi:hypothetical protein